MDPFERWNVRADAVVGRWESDGAVALLAPGRMGGMTLTALGEPAAAARLAAVALRDRDGEVARMTLPRGTLSQLDDAVAARVGDGADWDWMWTTRPPAPQPREDDVVDVDDDAAVAHLLAVASPRPSAQPGDAGVVGWVGVRSPTGALLACGARTEHVPGVPHLASVATSLRARGQGLGGAVTAALTRRSLAGGAEVCTLGMYADNGVARRMYARLGYRCEHRFSSRLVLPSPAVT